MFTYNDIARRVILPVGDFVYGTSISTHLRFLEKSQWRSLHDLRSYQNDKLRSLIRHAYENIPYYNRLFKENALEPESIGSVGDLQKLPLLSKNDIMENFDSIVVKERGRRKCATSSSGGTTGRTLKYLHDYEARSFTKAANIRGWGWAGYKIGDKYVELWSNPLSSNVHKGPSRKIMNLFRNKYVFNFFNVNEKILKQYVESIKKIEPVFIRGYVNAVYLLSKMIEPGEIQPNWIITTAESLTIHVRKEIEEKFNCRVFDEYGGEASGKANECHTHVGYHIPVEGVIVEFLKDGKPVKPGEIGEMVLTDLNNWVMPFVRYRIEDLGVPSSESCPCGRGLPLIDRIEGRVSDIIITPSGRLITRPGLFGSGDIKKIDGLREYQIVQQQIDKILIKVIGDEYYTNETETVILGWAQEAIGDEVDIEIKRVEEIPTAPSGKRKVVISNVKYEFN